MERDDVPSTHAGLRGARRERRARDVAPSHGWRDRRDAPRSRVGRTARRRPPSGDVPPGDRRRTPRACGRACAGRSSGCARRRSCCRPSARACRGSRPSRPRAAACPTGMRITSASGRSSTRCRPPTSAGRASTPISGVVGQHDGRLDEVLELAHVAREVVARRARGAPPARTRSSAGRGARSRSRGSARRAGARRSGARAAAACGSSRPSAGSRGPRGTAPCAPSPRGRRSSRRRGARRRGVGRFSPTRSTSRVWSTRRSFTCVWSGISPTSSRKSVPRSAASKRPSRSADGAGERALHVAEELALEQPLGERRAVDLDERARGCARSPRGAPPPRAPCRCPTRPRISTVAFVGADLRDRAEHLLDRGRLADEALAPDAVAGERLAQPLAATGSSRARSADSTTPRSRGRSSGFSRKS